MEEKIYWNKDWLYEQYWEKELTLQQMGEIALLIAFILVTSVFQAWIDGLLGIKTSGLLEYRVISRIVTLFTGACIWAIINWKGT